MTDVFNVTANYNQTSYVSGQTIVIAIAGADVLTTTIVTQGQIGPLALTVTAQDGAVEVLNVPQTTVSISAAIATTESVKITGVTDTSPTPRAWTINANGLSVSATA
jgi:hypothetical protein